MTTGNVNATGPVGRPSLTAMAGIGIAMFLPLAASVIQAGLLLDKLPVEERLSIKESRNADTKLVYIPADGGTPEILFQRPIRQDVTLNRKLNAASVSESLFRNAGTAPCSITVAQPDADNNPDHVMVTITPQGKGTVQLALTEKPPSNLKSLYYHDVAIGSTEPAGTNCLAVQDHLADEFRYHKSWAKPLEEVAYKVKFRRLVKTEDIQPGIFRNAFENSNPEKPSAIVSVVRIKPDSEPFSDSFTVVMKAEAPEGKERGYALLEINKDALLHDSNSTEIPRAGPIQAEQELAISPKEPGSIFARLEIVPIVTKAAVYQKVAAKLVFDSQIDTSSITADLFINKHPSGPNATVQITGRDEKTVDLTFICDKPGKVRLGISKRILVPDPKGFPVDPRIEDSKLVEIIEGALIVKAFHPDKRIIEDGGSVEYKIEFNQPVNSAQFDAKKYISNNSIGEIDVDDIRPTTEGKELNIRVTAKPGCNLIHLKIKKEGELKDPSGGRLSMDSDQVDSMGVVVGPIMLEVVPPATSGGTILVNAPYRMRVRNLPKDLDLSEDFRTGKIHIINKTTGNPIPHDWVNGERQDGEWTTEVRPKIPGPYEFVWEMTKPIESTNGKVIVMGKNNHGGKVNVADRWVAPPIVTKGPIGKGFSWGFDGIPKNYDPRKAYNDGEIEIWDGTSNKRVPREWGIWEWSETENRWVWVFMPKMAGTYLLEGRFSERVKRICGRDGRFGQKIEVQPDLFAPQAGKVLVVADTGFMRRDQVCNKAVDGMVKQLREGLKNPVLIVDRTGIREWQPIPPPAAEPLPLDRNELFVAYNQVTDSLKIWNNPAVEIVLLWCEDGEPNKEGVRQIINHPDILVAFAGSPNVLQGEDLQKKVPPIQRIECRTGFEAMASSTAGVLK